MLERLMIKPQSVIEGTPLPTALSDVEIMITRPGFQSLIEITI